MKLNLLLIAFIQIAISSSYKFGVYMNNFTSATMKCVAESGYKTVTYPIMSNANGVPKTVSDELYKIKN